MAFYADADVRDIAEQAGVDVEFVHRLIDVGAIGRDVPLGARAASRARLLAAWEQSGLRLDTIMQLVERGDLTLTFLDSPVVEIPARIDRSFEELATERDVPFEVLSDAHRSIGFEPPTPHDRAGEDDVALLDVVALFEEVGVPLEAINRLLGVYADATRRVGQAQAELFEAFIEGRLRRAGLGEKELIEFGTRFGDRAGEVLERILVLVYRRHRMHVWFDHAVNHAEEALAGSDLDAGVAQPPAICFVDLTGYTSLTEERGDEFAADVAGRLAALVKDISRSHGGRPIRWLGDGGMFHFRDPGAAVAAGLDMIDGAPAAGLPSAHVGVHTGVVIFQDGDVYGRTVNLAARIASYAQAGEVIASADTVRRVMRDDVEFETRGPIVMKNVAQPVELFEARRA